MSNSLQEQKKAKKKKERLQCSFCGQEITFLAKYCPNCGNEFKLE